MPFPFRSEITVLILVVAAQIGPANAQSAVPLPFPEGIPANCQSPMAMYQMMHDIQMTVGDRLGLQLVDLRDSKTIKIDGASGLWECEVVTVWSAGPDILGVFKVYRNAIEQEVYYWNGLRSLP